MVVSRGDEVTTGTVSNVAWLPYSKDVARAAKEHFEKRMYQDKQCARCEYLPERHCDTCDNCPAYLGHYRLWRKKLNKTTGRRSIGLPMGNRKLLAEVTEGVKFKDKRVRTPMVHALKMIRDLHDPQKIAVKKMASKGYGILEAPPRSGKTVMGIAIALRLGFKTIIMANQHEFLSQFLETIVGNKSGPKKDWIAPFTNANDFGGDKEVCGIAKKLEDFEKYDICLVTYQTFLSEKGQALLKQIAPMFGTVIIDEAHKVAANCFLKVVGAFPAFCRIGLTGTPERKDKKNQLTELVLGTVVHVMEVPTMKPRVVMVETGIKLPRTYKLWTAMETALVEHVDRNRRIIKEAVADLKAGRNIVIPVTRVMHAIALSKAINRVMRANVATHFIGTQKKEERKTIIEKARSGDVQCVVGIRSLVQLGINVPRWDMIYEVMYIANPPNLKQETARVRTSMPGKPQPIVKVFIEDTPQGRGCLRTCYWNTFKPEGFIFHQRDQEIINKYMGKDSVGSASAAKPIRL
jgi:superfamily II DNA or RNA helicase